MSSLVFLVPLALLLGGSALAAFLWSLRSGQYDDLEGSAARVLLDDGGDEIPSARNLLNRNDSHPHSRNSRETD